MRYKNPELMKRIKKYIENCYEKSSPAPSVQEIATAMGIAKSTAYRYLVDMADQHMISYEDASYPRKRLQSTHSRSTMRRW